MSTSYKVGSQAGSAGAGSSAATLELDMNLDAPCAAETPEKQLDQWQAVDRLQHLPRQAGRTHPRLYDSHYFHVTPSTSSD